MSTAEHCVKVFERSCLYGVTNIKDDNSPVIVEKIKAAIDGGLDIVQLRAKGIPDATILLMGATIRELTRKHNVMFVVNDRPDLAVQLDADGVHVGQDDMPVSEVRAYLSLIHI